MRARAGDPPRTMTQKILAGRSDDPNLFGDLVRVKVDQVVLARDPSAAIGDLLQLGAKRVDVEVAVAYETRCVTTPADLPATSAARALREALNLGLLVARPGIGFPAAVHPEGFGSPARLTVTDPLTFKRSWTLVNGLRRAEGGIYEVACHEGNIGLRGILAGARAQGGDECGDR